MALFEKETRYLLVGIGIGAGALLSAPFLKPLGRALTRPILKSLVKQGFIALEAGRVALARASETVEDVVAEVQHELAEERRGAPLEATAAYAPAGKNGNGGAPSSGA